MLPAVSGLPTRDSSIAKCRSKILVSMPEALSRSRMALLRSFDSGPRLPSTCTGVAGEWTISGLMWGSEVQARRSDE
ncbi:hypothetical protein D3C75_1282830 [compost metagenome]